MFLLAYFFGHGDQWKRRAGIGKTIYMVPRIGRKDSSGKSTRGVLCVDNAHSPFLAPPLLLIAMMQFAF